MGLEDLVYIATYCNTDVFESVIDGIPLMRRCSDDWINATQILRIAKFPKNQRTKILERQVQIHKHEKIQGGYGRFQGTWIPLDLAQKLATEYGIGSDIAPLLYTAGTELTATPFKRKGKPGRNLGIDNDINPSPTKIAKIDKAEKEAKKLKKSSSIPSGKKEKIVKKLKFDEKLNQDLYSQLHAQQQQQQQQQQATQFLQQAHMVPIPLVQQQQQQQAGPHPQFISVFQQQQQVQAPQYAHYNFPNQQQQPFYQYNIPQFQPLPQAGVQQAHAHAPTNSQDSVSSNIFSQTENDRRNSDGSVFSNHSVTLISPPVITSQQQGAAPPQFGNGTAHSNTSVVDEDEQQAYYTAQLLDYFERDDAEIPRFLYQSPLMTNFKVNEAIDEEGHTALHWGASLANLPIIEVLMNINNANPTTPNNNGINCLSKMIQFNNSFELQNFPQILELFKICLVTPDFNARIPLHYLMELFARQQGKNFESLRYYLEIIVKFAEELPKQNGKSLLKILLNHQDMNGDTVLAIGAKSAAMMMMMTTTMNIQYQFDNVLKMLLNKGADLQIRNNDGESCKDLLGSELMNRLMPQQQAVVGTAPSSSSSTVHTVPSVETEIQDQSSPAMNRIEEDKENIFIENQHKLARDDTMIGNTSMNTTTTTREDMTFTQTDDEDEGEEDNDGTNAPGPDETRSMIPPSIPQAPVIKVKKEVNTSSDSILEGQALRSFNDRAPSLVTSLNESMQIQLDSKDEEYRHVLSVYRSLHQNEKDVQKEYDAKYEQLFKNQSVDDTVDADDYDYEAKLKTKLYSKQKDYLKYIERSQSLQLAKLIQLQELEQNKECNEQLNQKDDDNIEAVIQLSLQQLKRKKLISTIILQTGSRTTKSTVNFAKYEKLISKACGLDEINDELLDDIEQALVYK